MNNFMRFLDMLNNFNNQNNINNQINQDNQDNQEDMNEDEDWETETNDDNEDENNDVNNDENNEDENNDVNNDENNDNEDNNEDEDNDDNVNEDNNEDNDENEEDKNSMYYNNTSGEFKYITLIYGNEYQLLNNYQTHEAIKNIFHAVNEDEIFNSNELIPITSSNQFISTYIQETIFNVITKITEILISNFHTPEDGIKIQEYLRKINMIVAKLVDQNLTINLEINSDVNNLICNISLHLMDIKFVPTILQSGLIKFDKNFMLRNTYNRNLLILAAIDINIRKTLIEKLTNEIFTKYYLTPITITINSIKMTYFEMINYTEYTINFINDIDIRVLEEHVYICGENLVHLLYNDENNNFNKIINKKLFFQKNSYELMPFEIINNPNLINTLYLTKIDEFIELLSEQNCYLRNLTLEIIDKIIDRINDKVNQINDKVNQINVIKNLLVIFDSYVKFTDKMDTTIFQLVLAKLLTIAEKNMINYDYSLLKLFQVGVDTSNIELNFTDKDAVILLVKTIAYLDKDELYLKCKDNYEKIIDPIFEYLHININVKAINKFIEKIMEKFEETPLQFASVLLLNEDLDLIRWDDSTLNREKLYDTLIRLKDLNIVSNPNVMGGIMYRIEDQIKSNDMYQYIIKNVASDDRLYLLNKDISYSIKFGKTVESINITLDFIESAESNIFPFDDNYKNEIINIIFDYILLASKDDNYTKNLEKLMMYFLIDNSYIERLNIKLIFQSFILDNDVTILDGWIKIIIDYINFDQSDSQFISCLFTKYNQTIKLKLFEKGLCKSFYTKSYKKYFNENLNLILSKQTLYEDIICNDLVDFDLIQSEENIKMILYKDISLISIKNKNELKYNLISEYVKTNYAQLIESMIKHLLQTKEYRKIFTLFQNGFLINDIIIKYGLIKKIVKSVKDNSELEFLLQNTKNSHFEETIIKYLIKSLSASYVEYKNANPTFKIENYGDSILELIFNNYEIINNSDRYSEFFDTIKPISLRFILDYLHTKHDVKSKDFMMKLITKNITKLNDKKVFMLGDIIRYLHCLPRFIDNDFLQKLCSKSEFNKMRDTTINCKKLYKFFELYEIKPNKIMLEFYPELISLLPMSFISLDFCNYTSIELIFNFEFTTNSVKNKILDIIINSDIELYLDLIARYKLVHQNIIDEKVILEQLTSNPTIIESLLDNDKFNQLLTNNHFWLYCNTNDNYLLSSCSEQIISKYIDNYVLDDLIKLNKFGIPRIFAFYEYPLIIDKLIEKFTIEVLSDIYDKYKRNIYYYLILNKNIKYEIDYNKLDSEFIVDILIQIGYLDPDTFKTYIIGVNRETMKVNRETNRLNRLVNKNYETFWMQIIKSQLIKSDIIEWAIDNKMIQENETYCDENHGSLLTYVIKYRPQLFDKIVEIDKNFMIKDTIDLMIDPCEDGYKRFNQRLNILYLAGILNVDIFSKLLKIISPLKLNRLLSTPLYLNSNEFNLQGILALNNPESFQVLISSDYCTPEMIDKTEQLLGSFAEVYEFQPASIYYMQTSPKFNGKIKYDEDEHFYGFNYKIKLNVNKIKNITHYILGKQELDIFNSCTICGTFKNKVIFTTCKHKFCIGCALKSNSCPLCRGEVKDSQKILI